VIDEGLVAFLRQMPGVAAEVEDRIGPRPLPQGELLPAVTYSDVSDVGSTSNSGPDCLSRLRYQIDHWAATRGEARRVERATRAALNGFRGQWPGGLRIGGVFRRNSWTVYEPETGLWRVITDYRINAMGE